MIDTQFRKFLATNALLMAGLAAELCDMMEAEPTEGEEDRARDIVRDADAHMHHIRMLLKIPRESTERSLR